MAARHRSYPRLVNAYKMLLRILVLFSILMKKQCDFGLLKNNQNYGLNHTIHVDEFSICS